VVLRERAEAELRERAEVVLRERAEAVLRERAEAVLRERAEAELRERAEVVLRERAEAELRERAEAVLRAESWVSDAPLLFCADAPVKSSGAAVLQLLFSSMHGEGDLLRHLGFLGYRVSHTQHPTCEFDYATTNLAVDLRDGVRLCKLVSVLTADRAVLDAAHIPAGARAAMKKWRIVRLGVWHGATEIGP
jgi:ElaB/YqjD/DUF883 family membrane-anchored ribosome-binding protein